MKFWHRFTLVVKVWPHIEFPCCNHGMTHMPRSLRSFELSANRQRQSSYRGIVHRVSRPLCQPLRATGVWYGQGAIRYIEVRHKKLLWLVRYKGKFMSGKNILCKCGCSELWMWYGPAAMFCSSRSTGSPSENTCSLTTSPKLRLSEASWPLLSTSGLQRKKRSSKS